MSERKSGLTKGKKKRSLTYQLLKNDKIRQQVLDGIICMGMLLFLIIAELISKNKREM